MEVDKQLSTILIVDDEPLFLDTLSDLLDIMDFNVKQTTSPIEGLKILKRENIKLIISDLKMNEMDGIQFLEKIKEYNPEIEVIILTGFTDLELVLSALKKGATDFIRKPIDIKDLKTAIFRAKEKLRKNLDLKSYYKKVESQNIDLLKYKNMLENRAKELEGAYDKITDLNFRLKQKIDHQVKEIVAKESQARYGELIQGIIHNINTPLSTIIGGLDLLKMIIKRDKEKEEFDFESFLDRIDRISGATKNIRNIIQNMLKRSRSENSVEKIEIDINELLSQELEFLKANMFFKHMVTKEINLAKDLPVFKGVYSDFSQIFLNIIKNGIEAMWEKESKVLGVSTENDNNKNIIVKISDTGSGIEKENIEKIFSIFFTTKPTESQKKVTDQPVGNGIGLNTVKRLADSYNIDIKIDTAVGVGTTFILTIPIEN
ncbi:MAG: hypothetical protein CSA15_04150 [Candidatus Delongbacteria bacterium]|nr:MAG: hypothetical protein CSA15_04150 [Candidatus Delongbacteria bacterium]